MTGLWDTTKKKTKNNCELLIFNLLVWTFVREKVIFVCVLARCRYVLYVYVVPVSWCGEHPQDDVPAMHPDDGAGGVEQVKVEMGITGH